MKRRRPPFVSTRTAWHPLFIRNLRRSLPRLYFHVSAEWSLSQEPLRQDAVVVRKKTLPPGFQPVALATLVPLLGEITLINVKGPQAQFDVADYLHLLACAALFCRDEEVEDPSQVVLMAVAPRITERCRGQIERRGRQICAHATPGISQVSGMDHRFWIVETDVVADPLLRFFSRHTLHDRASSSGLLLTTMEQAILRELMSDVKQLNSNPKLRLKYPDLEQVAMSMEEFAESLVEFIPVKKLLKGMSAEDRLDGLSAEDRLKGLPAEDRLKGLPAEDRLRALLATLTDEDLPEEQRRQLGELLKPRRHD